MSGEANRNLTPEEGAGFSSPDWRRFRGRMKYNSVATKTHPSMSIMYPSAPTGALGASGTETKIQTAMFKTFNSQGNKTDHRKTMKD